jgi:hypothetical protein
MALMVEVVRELGLADVGPKMTRMTCPSNAPPRTITATVFRPIANSPGRSTIAFPV